MKHYLLKFLIVIFFLYNCSSEKKSVSQNCTNEVVFIEYFEEKQGVALEGTAPQGPRIGQPTYSFSNENNSVEINKNVTKININNVNAVLGIRQTLKGTAGNGVNSLIHGIDKTPYTNGKLTIDKIKHNKVVLAIDNQQITLNTNQTWENKTTKRDTLNFNGKVVIETTYTQTIIFHGFIPRTNFVFN